MKKLSFALVFALSFLLFSYSVHATTFDDLINYFRNLLFTFPQKAITGAITGVPVGCVYGTATATAPVNYNNYRVYATLGGSSFVEISIKNNLGNQVDDFIITGWSPGTSASKDSTVAGITVTVFNVNALSDGTVIGASLGVGSIGNWCGSCTHGTVDATNGIIYPPQYKIYADQGSTDSWARIVVKDSGAGNTIDTKIINQGYSADFTSLNFMVKVISVKALSDGTVVGVDILIGTIGVGCTIPITTTTIPPTCTDSDSGKNYFVKGTCTSCSYTNQGGGCGAVIDTCSGSTLTECYCEGNNIASISYICPNCCIDGACVKVKCKDYDNSPDYINNPPYNINPTNYPDLFTKSYGIGIYAGSSPDNPKIYGQEPDPSIPKPTTNDYSTYYDHCANDNQLNEAFCMADGRLGAHGIQCPNGCKDGVCISVPINYQGTRNDITAPWSWRSDWHYTGTIDGLTVVQAIKNQLGNDNVGGVMSGSGLHVVDFKASNQNAAYNALRGAANELVSKGYKINYIDYWQSSTYTSTTTTTTTIPTTCTDSDGGKNYYVKGYCKDNVGVTHYMEDSCIPLNSPDIGNRGKLYETWCDNTSEGYQCVQSPLECPTGYVCKDGACVSTTTTTTSPTTTTTLPSTCEKECSNKGYNFGNCRNTCQVGEFGIGTSGCPQPVCAPCVTGELCPSCPTYSCCCSNKQTCPYECCENDPNYLDKTCLQQTTCTCACPVSGPCPPCNCPPPVEYVCIDHKCIPKSAYLIKFYVGWNMFSIPVKMGYATTTATAVQATEVFKTEATTTTVSGGGGGGERICAGDSLASKIWHYSNGKYVEASSIETGEGYWVKMKYDCVVYVTGQPVTINDFPGLNSGWNQIGGPAESVQFSTVVGDCNVANGPWKYNTLINQYEKAEYLKASEGYWIRVESACTLGSEVPPPPPTIGSIFGKIFGSASSR